MTPTRKQRIYGDYRKFDVKPSELIIRKTLMKLGKRLATYLKGKGFRPQNFKFEHVILENNLGLEPFWTVATKATEVK
jgi:hypothetical protein